MIKARLLLGLLVCLQLARGMAGETATATATVTAGFVTGITVTSVGSGYTTEPAVMLTGGGGSGATAKALLDGDKVSLVVVLSAGSGYTGAPTVVIEAPPIQFGMKLELVPKLTVNGPAGEAARVEWTVDPAAAPWTMLSNVVVGAEGAVLVDLTPGVTSRFYRATKFVAPAGFVWIWPNTFMMGSPLSEPGRSEDESQHWVTLTQGYWLSDHEVTQSEYQAVMGINPSAFKGGNLPVEQVSWNDAVAYCQKLTQLDRAAGRITVQQAYRLPTEAEWEYAARAGTTGANYGELDAIAWWMGQSGGQTQPVKGKQPNKWGLYDMIGNVGELCSDLYGAYPTEAVTDPTGPRSGTNLRVIRGGNWRSEARNARSAKRLTSQETSLGYLTGFRLALSSVR